MMKRLAILLLILLSAAPAWAQKATLAPDPWITFLNNSGQLVNQGCVWTYAAGTTTPATTWADPNQVTSNANPIILNGDSRVSIYLAPTLSYKFVFEQPPCNSGLHGATIRTQDNIAAVPAGSQSAFFDDFRLTLSSGTAVTTSDVTAATTLYLATYVGNRLTLFDSGCNATTYNTGQISIAVPSTTSQLYDVYVYANNGTPTLELLAWTNDTTRATSLSTCTGRLVKSTDTSRLYVGSFRTTTVAGQTEDSVTKRYLWNYYNRVRRPLLKQGNANYNYTTATWRQANADATMQVDIVAGVAEALIDLSVAAVVFNTNTNVIVIVGIGEDSTTAPLTSFTNGGLVYTQVASLPIVIGTRLTKLPAVGRHVYTWLEFSQATGTTSWQSNPATAFNVVGGLNGWFEG